MQSSISCFDGVPSEKKGRALTCRGHRIVDRGRDVILQSLPAHEAAKSPNHVVNMLVKGLNVYFSRFSGKGHLNEKEQRVLWNLIINSAVRVIDLRDSAKGLARYTTTRELVIDNLESLEKDESIEVSEARTAINA